MSLPFNVRVYGILIDQGRLLVSDERHHDLSFTKLPGGGLQFGEGTIDCLKFNPLQQVISIYYTVQPTNELSHDPTTNFQNEHGLRWVELDALAADTFSLPIDRHIAPMIKTIFK